MRRMKNTKKLTSFLFLTAIVLLVAGFSFAYFNFSKVQTDYSLIVGGGTINLNFDYSTDYHIPDMPCTEREAMTYTPIEFTVKGINDKKESIFYEIRFDDLISAADETLFGDTDIIQFSLKKNGDFIYREKSYDDFDGEIIDIGSVTPKSGMSVNDKYELWLWIRDDVLVSDSPKYTQGFYKVFDTLSFDRKVALTGISINAYEGLGVTLKTNFNETDTHKVLVEAHNLYTNGSYIQLTNEVPLIEPNPGVTIAGSYFYGWSESKDGPVKYYPGDIITESKTLYAQYTNRMAFLYVFDTINVLTYSNTAFSRTQWPATGYYGTDIRPYVKEIYFNYTSEAFGRAGVDNGYYNYYLISTHGTRVRISNTDHYFIQDDLYVKWDSTNKILRIDSPSSINFYSPTSKLSLFYNCPNLYTVSFLNFNLRFDENYKLFYSCSSLRNIDLTGVYFNNQNSKTFYCSFRNCTNLEEITLPKLIDNPDMVYSGFCCFTSDSKLKKINWDAFNHQKFGDSTQFLWNTAIEEFDMSYMNFGEGAKIYEFFRYSKIKSVHMSGPDYSKVIDAKGFLGNTKIENLNMSYLDFSSCTSFESMLSNCPTLKIIRMDNMITSSLQTMLTMFSNDTGLTTATMNNTDLSNVTTMRGLFYTCGALRLFEWSGTPSKSIQNVQDMFFGCKNLEVADVSMTTPEYLVEATAIFAYCDKLKTILSNCNWYNLVAPTNGWGFFNGGKPNLAGGNGTVYSVTTNANVSYCKIDDDVHAGYFTLKDPNILYVTDYAGQPA